MTQRRRVCALAVALLVAVSGACGGSTARAQVGDRARAFSTVDLDGERVRLESWRGFTVVINFWASWCIPCRHEFPLLAKLDARPNVVVLGVLYNDTDENARRFMAEHGATWPGLKDDGRIARAYRIGPGIPSTIVVDPTGVIRLRHIGEVRETTDLLS
ncbi:MAG: cytochrome c biosis protein CcmG, thiol:disulfide interchange protein DsbE [Actinomycetota bacterium]|jgi:cytochrome c biogenesis protein CcmG/thiol:disulfide interchange protein DsbE